jgi:hypothetical protein
VRKLARTNEDPVIAKIRAIRSRLLKKAGGTVGGNLELMRKLDDSRATQAGKPKVVRAGAQRKKKAA